MMNLDRRKFLKYAGATAAVVGASALGLDYFLKPPANLNQTSTMSTLVQAPPTISDFAWTPDQDDIHKAVISFNAADTQSLLQSAQLTVNPHYPPELNQAAFPTEGPQTFQLTPTTGAFASKSATFTQPVTVKGGKSYEASIEVANSAGNRASTNQGCPYVREFENITINRGLRIGAYYYTWYLSGNWVGDESPKGTPLLGYYDSDDSTVVSKHIDWASGHGISFFLSSWWGYDRPDVGYNREDANTLSVFSNTLADGMDIGIVYESKGRLKPKLFDDTGTIDLDDNANVQLLTGDMRYFTQNYFQQPQYLTVNGRPLILYYLSRWFKGDIANAIGQVRDIAQDAGYKLFIVGDEFKWSSPEEVSADRLRLFDAITAYSLLAESGYNVNNSNYEPRLDAAFNYWSQEANGAGIKFIPVAMPGFRLSSFPQGTTERDPTKFASRLSVAGKYVDSEIQMLLITSFNEWWEGTFVEPSIDEEFEYLNTIRDFFAGQ
jgi:hypothetical protein